MVFNEPYTIASCQIPCSAAVDTWVSHRLPQREPTVRVLRAGWSRRALGLRKQGQCCWVIGSASLSSRTRIQARSLCEEPGMELKEQRTRVGEERVRTRMGWDALTGQGKWFKAKGGGCEWAIQMPLGTLGTKGPREYQEVKKAMTKDSNDWYFIGCHRFSNAWFHIFLKKQ